MGESQSHHAGELVEWKIFCGRYWETQPVRESQHLKAESVPKIVPQASLDSHLNLLCNVLAHAHLASTGVCLVCGTSWPVGQPLPLWSCLDLYTFASLVEVPSVVLGFLP